MCPQFCCVDEIARRGGVWFTRVVAFTGFCSLDGQGMVHFLFCVSCTGFPPVYSGALMSCSHCAVHIFLCELGSEVRFFRVSYSFPRAPYFFSSYLGFRMSRSFLILSGLSDVDSLARIFIGEKVAASSTTYTFDR